MNGHHTYPIRGHRFEEAIEGFYLETVEGLFFAVKGMEHPPGRRIAVLRYAPDAPGRGRRKGNAWYRRLYHFDEQERLLKTEFAQYLCYDPVFQATLQSVPEDCIRAICDPRTGFRELARAGARSALEEDAVAFLNLLRDEAGVPGSSLGITGSLLIGMNTEDSDLDIVVFGEENCYKVYRTLRRILDAADGSELRRLGAAGMQDLFAQRSADTRMEFDAFLASERRKVNQGLFRKKPYFARFVKDVQEADEIYGRQLYTPLGRAVIEASVADEGEAIFTPCRYPLTAVHILDGPEVPDLDEIVSFRGRFCEQARAGETVRASGTLERVHESRGRVRHRLLLGNSREDGMIVP